VNHARVQADKAVHDLIGRARREPPSGAARVEHQGSRPAELLKDKRRLIAFEDRRDIPRTALEMLDGWKESYEGNYKHGMDFDTPFTPSLKRLL